MDYATSLARLAEDNAAKLEKAKQLIKEENEGKKKHVALKKQRAGYPAASSSPRLSSALSQPTDMKVTITRFQDGDMRAYQIYGGVDGPLEPVATYRIESNEEILDHAVAPDLGRAAYTTRNSLVCISQDGDLLWRYELEPHSTQHYGHSPSCVFSLDGTWVWVYRPDAMANRGPDMLVVLRADTGDVVAKVELDSVGHGAHLAQHPDGRHVLLGVGEGQDGAKIFRAALTYAGIDLYPYGWIDRCLVDLASDGRWFMTIDHSQTDVAFHNFPDGKIVLHLPVAAFGYQDEKLFIDWRGGFLYPDIAIVTIMGRTDEQEWRHHHQVNLRTGAPFDRFEASPQDGYDFELLGDGSWIISKPDSNLIRRHDS